MDMECSLRHHQAGEDNIGGGKEFKKAMKEAETFREDLIARKVFQVFNGGS